ncbi:Proteasome assembly chaperone [Parasponia andersonii]|uniref:Proteasome assembly chaperone n=1 Tax=Parasponia andersonii TaxID=3476 RepID=A0A2P5D7M5_PARAD|nr:Proteasome assembly chaperone [Parasponia andersonii]
MVERRLRKKRVLKHGIREQNPEATAASEFMFVVTDDVLLEILLRLPDAKTVIRFGSVCKRWFSLVSRSEYFIRNFNHLHLQKRQLLGPNGAQNDSQLPYTLLMRGVYETKLPVLYITYPERFQCLNFFCERSKTLHPSPRSSPTAKASAYLDFLGWKRASVVSTFDDLVLVQRTPWFLFICNPVTRQRVALPRAPTLKHIQAYRLGFVCKPNCSHSKASSGASSSSSSSYHCNCGINFRVALIWSDRDHRRRIAAFDPFKSTSTSATTTHDDLEQCRLISLPVDFERGSRAESERARLGVVRGQPRLSQLYLAEEANSYVLKVWELDTAMSRSCSPWDLVHHVSLVRSDESMLFLIALHPEDGDAFFFTRRDGDDRDICQYKIGSDNFEPVCESEYDIDSFCVFPLVHPWWPTKIPSMWLRNLRSTLAIATQIGTMGTIPQARKDEGVLTGPTFDVSVIFGKRDEPMLVACAGQLVEQKGYIRGLEVEAENIFPQSTKFILVVEYYDHNPKKQQQRLLVARKAASLSSLKDNEKNLLRRGLKQKKKKKK